MKKLLLVGISACAVSAPALADDQSAIPGNFSTTIGFASEYSFRGIAQSDEKPAVQGSIDWSHDSGFYLGVWGSNVELTDASLELDIYGGYSGEYKGFNYDVGALYYSYPGANDKLNYDFYEGALALGYDFDVAAVSTSVNYSPNFAADSGEAFYTAAYLDVPLPFLPFSTSLNANIGRQNIDRNDRFGFKDYNDWGIGLSSNVEGFDLSIKYIDSNLSEPRECRDGCSEKVIFTISKTLP